MKALNEYNADTRDNAEAMLENAYLTEDRLQCELFADYVGDDSIEISRLLMNMFKASTTTTEGDLMAAMIALEHRMIANACEAFDSGALT